MAFPIIGQLILSLYLSLFSRYLHFPISGSRPWPFGVTWRHWSCDQWIPRQPFPIDSPLWPSVYLQPFSRYSPPKCLTSANRHCACAISRDLYPLCKIWVHILISHSHITYSLWHFYWAPMKNKGCLLVRPPMLNAKLSENSPDQNWLNFGGFGGLGVSKSFVFTPKGNLREPTSFEPFCVKIGRGVWPSGRFGKKSKKSQRLP